MESKEKFVAQYLTSEQYTEDNWRITTPTLEVSASTTIGEIREWMNRNKALRITEFKVLICDPIPPKQS